MELKFCQNISHHFSWYKVSQIPLNLYYHRGFVGYDMDLNEPFFEQLQNQFLDITNYRFSQGIKRCHLFLALSNNDTKIGNYNKVWKKIGSKYNIKNFLYSKEEVYNDKANSYFVGLASFEEKDLKTALAIQTEYYNYSFILIDFSLNENTIDIQLISSYFLQNNIQEGFIKLFTEYCGREILVIRVGNGGEEIEIDFVFSPILVKDKF